MFCYGTGPEVSNKLIEYEPLEGNTEMITKNIFHWFGSLLYNSVTLQDCYERTDGECVGRIVSDFVSLVFDLDVLNDYQTETETEDEPNES